VTAHQDNLTVLTEHIRRLATDQQAAAGRITLANQSARDIAANLWSTHGAVCAATNIAVSTAETARGTAGTVLYNVSTEHSEKLANAADNYDNVDSREGKDIGACGL
jgi:Excreted virulence factor EspC, type VII ESX diderm